MHLNNPINCIPIKWLDEDEDKSILRNRLIANALFFSKDIEKLGTGINRIMKIMKRTIHCFFNDTSALGQTLERR